MKSLLISGTYFSPYVGGISHFMTAIATSLGSERICCLTGVPAGSGTGVSGLERRVYRRPSAFATGYRQAFGWSTAITQIMLQERPRAVQLSMADEGYLGLWLRRWLGLPFVIYAHGNEILGAMRDEWPKPRLALQQADRVFANSRFTADLVRQAGVDPQRVEIVHPGCDSDHFKPLQPRADLRRKLLGPREKDRVILTVGGLVARKGHDKVIQALPKILKSIPDVVHLIVGDGPHRGQLEELARSVGVQDRVIFAGRIGQDGSLPEIYALSDVFAMPSRNQIEANDVEGFGLVFLEANACGKPVVGGRAGGIPDAIVDGETGYLVNPHDPEDVAGALLRILSNAELAGRFGTQGRQRVVRDFQWAQVSDHVQNVITTIVHERRSADPLALSPRRAKNNNQVIL